MNNAIFQDDLFTLPKHDRHSAIATLNKLHKMSWTQVYNDNGIKWEKIKSGTPPPGVSAVYSLRLTQSLRAIAYRDDDFLRLLTIPPDHDATYATK